MEEIVKKQELYLYILYKKKQTLPNKTAIAAQSLPATAAARVIKMISFGNILVRNAGCTVWEAASK